MRRFLLGLIAALTLAVGAAPAISPTPAAAQMLLTGAGRQSASVPGSQLTSVTTELGTTPLLYYSAAFSPYTQSGSGPTARVATVTDVQNSVVATAGAQANWKGPKIMTDGLGRRFWRFEGNEYLTVGPAFTAAAGLQQHLGLIMIGRFHRWNNGNVIFSLGSNEAGTAITTGGGPLWEVFTTNNAGGYFRSVSNTPLGQTNQARVIPGAQLQVAAVAKRNNGGLGGTSFFLDGIYAQNTTNAQNNNGSAGAATTGAEIGRYSATPPSPNTANPIQDGGGLVGDIYAIIVADFSGNDTQMNNAVTKIATDWAIQAKTDQVVIDNSSRFYGLASGTGGGTAPTSGDTLAMQLSDPGSAFALGPTYAVRVFAASGNTTAMITARRDQVTSGTLIPHSWPNFLMPGRNIAAIVVGLNDRTASSLTSDQSYAAHVALINTPTSGAVSGYLQRGWTIRYFLATAVLDSGNQAWQAAINAKMRLPQFLIDVDAAPGGTYDGKISVVDLPAIQVGAAFPFRTTTDVNSTYFQGDNTHASVAGITLMMTGGDTPANGVSYAVQH